MYNRPQPDVEKYRITTGRMASDARFGNNGVFIVPGPVRAKLLCIVSDQLGWEHVSTSPIKQKRCPTWEEMEYVKRLFWKDNECMMQLHVPRENWIDNHPFTLHLWKPTEGEIPRPPHTMVGFKTPEEGLSLLRKISK